jgi:broad specificity phosphatase PhoE
MRHVVLVRHGESELNALNQTRRVYCGQIETPLTALGRQQAIRAAQEIRQLEFLQIRRAISSPLARAAETLQIMLEQLGPTSGQVERLPASPGLMERSHGAFEGLAEEDAFAQYPHYRDDPNYREFMNHFEQHAPGGENLAIVSSRAWQAIEPLVAEPLGDLLVVSHYNTIRCLVGRALGLAPDAVLRMRIPNARPIVLRCGEPCDLVAGSDILSAVSS